MRWFLFLIIIFYFLALIQSSFLIHFSLSGITPNLILISVCLLSFFSTGAREVNKITGVFPAIAGGFFLDAFSGSFFGLSIAILLIISFFIRKVLGILKEPINPYPAAYFIFLFIFCLIFYDLSLKLSFTFFQSIPLQFSLTSFLTIIGYNLGVAVILFYSFKWLSLKLP